MIEAINIPRPTYSEELDAIEKVALEEDRTPTKMATILVMEAIAHREARRLELNQKDGNLLKL